MVLLPHPNGAAKPSAKGLTSTLVTIIPISTHSSILLSTNHTHLIPFPHSHTLPLLPPPSPSPPSPFRRQKELIAPMLFEVARTGNKDLLFKIWENGDDINPTVRARLLPRQQ